MAVSFSGIEECPPGNSTVKSMFTNPFSPVPITATGLPKLLKRSVSICPPSSNTNAGFMLFSLNHFEKILAPLFPAISSSCPNVRYTVCSGTNPSRRSLSTASIIPIAAPLSSTAPRPQMVS